MPRFQHASYMELLWLKLWSNYTSYYLSAWVLGSFIQQANSFCMNNYQTIKFYARILVVQVFQETKRAFLNYVAMPLKILKFYIHCKTWKQINVTSAGRALGPGKKLITRPSYAIMIQIIVNKNEIKLSWNIGEVAVRSWMFD